MDRRGGHVATWVLLVGVTIACSYSIREGTGDETITARVVTALVNDPQVGRFRFEVDTFDGVVMLPGEVDSAGAATRAVTVVRAVDDSGGALTSELTWSTQVSSEDRSPSA